MSDFVTFWGLQQLLCSDPWFHLGKPRYLTTLHKTCRSKNLHHFWQLHPPYWLYMMHCMDKGYFCVQNLHGALIRKISSLTWGDGENGVGKNWIHLFVTYATGWWLKIEGESQETDTHLSMQIICLNWGKTTNMTKYYYTSFDYIHNDTKHDTNAFKIDKTTVLSVSLTLAHGLLFHAD